VVVTESTPPMTAERSTDAADLEREKERRRRAQAEVEALRVQVRQLQAELRRRQQEVRYQIGDALVRAAKPSWDTLKLPWRLLCLLRLGLERRRQRSSLEQGPQTRLPHLEQARCAPRRPARKPEHSERTQPSADLSATFEPQPLVSESFGRAAPELRRRDNLCIAAVTDEFSWWAWQFEADVYTFSPGTWREVLEERPPHLLLVESTWRGLAGCWHYQVRELGQHPDLIPDYALPEIVAWCRQRRIPTVFYNKEDPPNFAYFIDAARLFDFVFTSDANCLEAYRRHLGHERIWALPFAAQPRIHNPVWVGPRDGAVCFAGTWYQHRHADRQDAAGVILRPALDFGLHIYDRMAGSDDPNYSWPPEFRSALCGDLPYSRMLTAYKRYKVFLNVNSVTDSPTMFARRVFELLACGTPVVSAWSRGIAEMLGEDVVLLSNDPATTRRHLTRLLGDGDYRARLALRGQRRVFAQHTYTHRLQTILEAAGLACPALGTPDIAMLATVAQQADLSAAWENYRRQSYGHKRLFLCVNDARLGEQATHLAAADGRVRVVWGDAASWGRVLRQALEECDCAYVAALHPRDFYGPHYLTDYAHALLYAREPALGKAAYYEQTADGKLHLDAPHLEYRTVPQVRPWTLCMPGRQLRERAAALDDVSTPADWWRGVLHSLGSAYSTDRFNYLARPTVLADAAQEVHEVVV